MTMASSPDESRSLLGGRCINLQASECSQVQKVQRPSCKETQKRGHGAALKVDSRTFSTDGRLTLYLQAERWILGRCGLFGRSVCCVVSR